MRDQERGKRLLAVAEAGEALVGLPPLFVYLFGVWAGLIVLLALIVERGRR
jgi:hypothetical protein